MRDTEVFYREEQRFDQFWLRLLIWGGATVAVVVFGWGLYQQLVLGRPWGDKPMSDTWLIVTAAFVIGMEIGLVWLFAAMALITEVWSDRVYVRFYPFRPGQVLYEDLAEYYVRNYSPIKEYGGWGIRWGASGKALNVKGHRGVQFVFTNGSRLLIGSQCPEEMAEAIRMAKGCGGPGAV